MARMLYIMRLQNVRKAYGRRRVRVIIPVGNLAKWKMQSLFDLLQSSGKYDPIIALTIMDVENALSSEEKTKLLDRLRGHFKSRGMECVLAYDCAKEKALSFECFHPDIVFYQQPWTIAEVQRPSSVSRIALTCYVPYYVENYGVLEMACDGVFQRTLWRYFCQNNDWAKIFKEYQGFLRRSGEIVGLGHPMLDQFYLRRNEQVEKKYVIYAPHFSCNIVECFSTFLKNGKEILALAKSHPEINWVFKPHPTLRHTLEEHCGWTREEINAYYAEWEKISTSCYDSNYVTLFKQSYALITDCASFLVEYACTGSPIIHLISSNAKYKPHPIAAKLFGTYYQAHNWGEFMMHFEKVVLQHDDYKRSERLLAIKDMRLLDNYAAKNIVNYLDSVFSGK